jgi:hypothetical protein
MHKAINNAQRIHHLRTFTQQYELWREQKQYYPKTEFMDVAAWAKAKATRILAGSSH